MKQILPGLHTLDGMRMGRVYLIEDADGLTLIDTALNMSVAAILQQIGSKPLKRILITHGHPDHIGGLPAVKKAIQAEVIASEVEQPYIEGKLPLQQAPGRFQMPAQTMPGTPVDRVVKDGEVISEAFGGLQVIFAPGHSPGHLAFWQPEKRVLFTGDTMMHLFGRLRLPIPMFTVDMDENRRSIARLAALQPEVLCFGHGAPITQGAAKILEAFAQRISA